MGASGTGAVAGGAANGACASRRGNLETADALSAKAGRPPTRIGPRTITAIAMTRTWSFTERGQGPRWERDSANGWRLRTVARGTRYRQGRGGDTSYAATRCCG